MSKPNINISLDEYISLRKTAEDFDKLCALINEKGNDQLAQEAGEILQESIRVTANLKFLLVE